MPSRSAMIGSDTSMGPRGTWLKIHASGRPGCHRSATPAMLGSQAGPNVAFELGVEPVVPLTQPRRRLRVDVSHGVDRVQVREVEHRHAHRTTVRTGRHRGEPAAVRAPDRIAGPPSFGERHRGRGRDVGEAVGAGVERTLHGSRRCVGRRSGGRSSRSEEDHQGGQRQRARNRGDPSTVPGSPSKRQVASERAGGGGCGEPHRVEDAAGSVGSSSSASAADRSVDAVATSSRMRRARIRKRPTRLARREVQRPGEGDRGATTPRHRLEHLPDAVVDGDVLEGLQLALAVQAPAGRNHGSSPWHLHRVEGHADREARTAAPSRARAPTGPTCAGAPGVSGGRHHAANPVAR